MNLLLASPSVGVNLVTLKICMSRSGAFIAVKSCMQFCGTILNPLETSLSILDIAICILS